MQMLMFLLKRWRWGGELIVSTKKAEEKVLKDSSSNMPLLPALWGSAAEKKLYLDKGFSSSTSRLRPGQQSWCAEC